ncbi:hypothetical protein [Pseudovibrio sp. Tun.PSC04-5.I4]|uniref:hypothetical protein n=1 Tax=Pseudovibrio sp. Tun.PSC04-5.I4 TaxID=1798213 RepID=UPI000882E18C|nr:hypothetical protein [Pseudovibrio sp. Tun.PSC04-5.I4]SDR22060.1 hypothetical protein SAMN04515695_3511 [Pseudovibrio sp. Tun.PSC04-5.I4]
MGRSPIHTKVSQPPAPQEQTGASASKTSSSHKGHKVAHAQPKNVHRLLDQLDELNGKSTRAKQPPKSDRKDPQLRPLAYHKHHKPADEPVHPTDGMSRAAKKVRFEGYRLPQDKLLANAQSKTGATPSQPEPTATTSGPKPEAPLAALAGTLDQITASNDPDLSDRVVAGKSEAQASGVTSPQSAAGASNKPTLEAHEGPLITQAPTEQVEVKPHPALLALQELDLTVSPEVEEKFQAYQEKKAAFLNDPIGTAHEGQEAAVWQHRIKDTLGMPQDKADTFLRMQFRTGLDNDARALAKQAFEDAIQDPRFVSFLKTAALATPEDLTSDHKELLVFLSQNMKALNKEIVGDVNSLIRQHAYSKGLSDAVDQAKANVVTDKDIKHLNEVEKDVIAFRMATAKQLGEALNASNDLQATMSFGDAILASTQSLSHENGRAQYALASLREVASALTEQHLAQNNSPKKTQAWIAKQPWATLVSVSIKTDGAYFNVGTELRGETVPLHVGNSTFYDKTEELPRQELTKTDLRHKPERVLNGLRSDDIRQALQLTPTGEDGIDDLLIVEKPSDLALMWGSTLMAAHGRGDNISELLPDYFVLREVRYHKLEGFLIETDMLQPAWVVEYKPTSHTLTEVGRMNTLPQAAARNLADLAINLNTAKATQTEQKDEVTGLKSRLDAFLSTKGDGLLMSFGKAHFVLDKLMEHARDEVHARIEKTGGSLKKVQKWVSEQSWSALFDVTVTRPEGGKKSEYLISVKQKTLPEPVEPHHTTVTVEDHETQEAGATAQAQHDEFPGLSGSLRALLQPDMRQQLIIKPTGESNLGADIVEKPSKLAREWGALLMKDSSAKEQLPEYLELREVQYHSEAKFTFRKGHLKTCWVLEFKPEALNTGRL